MSERLVERWEESKITFEFKIGKKYEWIVNGISPNNGYQINSLTDNCPIKS